MFGTREKVNEMVGKWERNMVGALENPKPMRQRNKSAAVPNLKTLVGYNFLRASSF